MADQMTRVILFGLLQTVATLYALRRGGWPERLVGLSMVAAMVAGWLLPFTPEAYRHVEVGRLATDVALAALVYAVGLRADRYWPLWMSALQMLSVGVHGVRSYDPTLVPLAYHHLIAWISYLMLAVLVAGTLRHDRRTRPAAAGPSRPVRDGSRRDRRAARGRVPPATRDL